MAPLVRRFGYPTSANGASSFHLIWELEPKWGYQAIETILCVRRPPVVDDLYFWALQVSFYQGTQPVGSAHLGLQWNRRHPGFGAINWGGYSSDGSILPGDESPFPSTPADRNTRDYPWVAGTRYCLRISKGVEDGDWVGEVQLLPEGETQYVRSLHGGGDSIGAPMVWSEVFARCEAPSVVVAWNGSVAIDGEGHSHVPSALIANYQAEEAGGCSNSNSYRRGDDIRQATAHRRRTRQGGRVPL